MHVCHMCDSSLEGDYFRNIAKGLSERGVPLTLIQLSSGEPPAWIGDYGGVSYETLRADSKTGYIGAIWRLRRVLDERGADILQTHLYYSGLIGVLVKRLRPRTIVALMRHHTSVVRMLGSRVHVALDRWMAERADHVLTVSEAARRYMIDTDGIRSDIGVVYLGFDYERLKPDAAARERVRGELGFAASDFVIGYVANFAPGKGHEQLVAAFEKILTGVPNARLILAGRGALPEVTKAAGRLPNGKVVFAGWRPGVPAFMNSLDVFVQPSLSEAFSQVIMEAMGVGLPVVATNVGGASEVIESGRNAVLVEPDDVDALSNAVTGLARDTDLRSRLGAAARETVTERFGADRMVERHLELYKKWLKRS